MKNLIFISLLLFGPFLSCNTKSNGPEKNAEKFLVAIANADFKEAKTFCTEGTKTFISMAESFASEIKKGDVEIKIEGLNCKEDGDKATCTYCCNDKGENETLKLKKEDGEWLVSISKDDIEK